MILLVQRVKKASVTTNDIVISNISKGLLVFAGLFSDDTEEDILYCAKKCSELRIFDDSEGKLNLSVKDVRGQILAVSQFTLCAQTKKGRRPGFDKAMKAPKSKDMFDFFLSALELQSADVKTGQFGEHMDVALINDGPVTIIIDSKEKRYNEK